MPDDEVSGSSPESEDQEQQQTDEEEASASQADDTAEGEESKPKQQAVPLKRFQQVTQQNRQYREQQQALQQELNDLRTQLASKNGKKPEASEEEDKPLTPAQIKAIDRVLKQSHPKLFETIERMEAQQQDSENAMIARAERDITKMATEANFATDEESLSTLAEMVGNRIRDDATLAAMWRARDPLCLELAFKKVEKSIQNFQRKTNGKAIQTGKKLAKLPTAPLGGTTTSTPKPESKNKGKGLTSGVHDDAWAVLQGHLQQD